VISQDEVLRRLALEELEANGQAAPAVTASSLPSTHVAAAIASIELLREREVATTQELLDYAQAEALVAIALTLTDLRNLVSRGKP
jgi:hypothetical protein